LPDQPYPLLILAGIPLAAFLLAQPARRNRHPIAATIKRAMVREPYALIAVPIADPRRNLFRLCFFQLLVQFLRLRTPEVLLTRVS